MNCEKNFVIKTSTKLIEIVNYTDTYDAYLDIETTGLSKTYNDITVVGIYLNGKNNAYVIQLIEDGISTSILHGLMRSVSSMYTYNGKNFDLPFIESKLGIDLEKTIHHTDLMLTCYKRDLYGGFKI